MRALAVALYQLMKKERFGEKCESLREFLIREIEAGDLPAGQVKNLNDSFHGKSAVATTTLGRIADRKERNGDNG